MPALYLIHRVFGSGGLGKGLGFELNPRIDSCSVSYHLVDGMSNLCKNGVSARQVVMHIDFAGSSLTSC
jgi:hypothetical protein